jgi:hypothetical protein
MLSFLGIWIGVADLAGIAWAGAVNSIAYVLWAMWLLVSGVFLLRRGKVSVRFTKGSLT